jgi:hypothetical protein
MLPYLTSKLLYLSLLKLPYLFFKLPYLTSKLLYLSLLKLPYLFFKLPYIHQFILYYLPTNVTLLSP